MASTTRLVVCGLLSFVAVSFSGCGSDGPRQLFPVSGKVFYQDRPLGAVTVQFVSDESTGSKGHSAQGRTAADGSFTLETHPFGQGVAPGRYKVIVLYYSRNDMLPRKYTKFYQTPLVAEVKESGANDFVFTLED